MSGSIPKLCFPIARIVIPVFIVVLPIRTVGSAQDEQTAIPRVIHDGTPIRLAIKETISSADSKVGENVYFEVLEDLKVGETTVIPRSALAVGTISQAEKKKTRGRGGKLEIKIEYVRLANEEKVPLRGAKENQGEGKPGLITTGVIVSSLLFFPAAPAFLLVKGKDVMLYQGTAVTAYVDGEYGLSKKPQLLAQEQNTQHQSSELTEEIGVMFYRESGSTDLRRLAKSVAIVKRKGPGLLINTRMVGELRDSSSKTRLTPGQKYDFVICGIDPTRYKLYSLQQTQNTRDLPVAQGGQSVLSKSEIPVTIRKEGSCYLLAPAEYLDRGEYGFSPVDSNDVFDFGVGTPKATKK